MWIKLLVGRNARRAKAAACVRKKLATNECCATTLVFWAVKNMYYLRIEECMYENGSVAKKKKKHRRGEWFPCRRHLNATKRRVKRKSLKEFSGRPLARFIAKEKKKKQNVSWIEPRPYCHFSYSTRRHICVNKSKEKRQKRKKKRILPAIISMHQMVDFIFFRFSIWSGMRADLIYTPKCVKYIVLLEL